MDSIEQYIKSSLRSGFSYNQIRARLRAAGYDPLEIEEALVHVRRVFRHRLWLGVFSLLILSLGFFVMLNFEQVSLFVGDALTVHEDIVLNLTGVVTNFSSSAEFPVNVVEGDVILFFKASGVFCPEPALKKFSFEGVDYIYNPLKEKLEVVNGNVIRHKIPDLEKDAMLNEEGWPVVDFYFNDALVGSKAIVSSYAEMYNISFYADGQGMLRVAFDNPCAYYEKRRFISRNVYFFDMSLVERAVVPSNVFRALS